MASPEQLPDKLVFYNILPRLPFRALIRLTAVCKAWHRTICRDDAFATAQAQNPSRASVAMARFVEDSLQLEILSPCSKDVVPPEPDLSFVEVDHGSRLSFCACTGGVVLLKERRPETDDGTHRQNFVVVNPNRRTDGIRRVPYEYEGEVVTAGLAYDPETAPSEGFELVVPVVEDGGRCRFRRFTSRRGEWSASREAFALPPLEEFKPRPVYAKRNEHMFWVAGDVLVWYDLDKDCAGTVVPLRMNAGSGTGCGTKLGIGAWRGRLRVAYVNTRGVSVSELAGGGGEGPERWEVVHEFRLWREVPGLLYPESNWTRVSWKLGTVEMEAGGEEAVCVVVTMERVREAHHSEEFLTSTWRGLLRYDVRTGTALSVLELRDEQRIGPLLDYHSIMAKLPDITYMGPSQASIHEYTT